MMLNQIDQNLFYQINHVWTHPALDVFFVELTDFTKTPVFYVMLLLILIALHRRYGWQALAVILGAVVLSTLSDFASSEFLKPLVARPRPEFANLPFEVLLRRPSEGSFSFPSSHALDSFVIASFIIYFSRAWGIALLVLAGLIAYSRVYCGLHFPIDVLAGSFLGFLVGWSGGYFADKWVPREK